MIHALLGKKLDQTQMFLEDGRRVPVTEVAVLDNVVVQVKTAETDEYTALQLGYGSKKRPTKAVLGHAKKSGLEKAPAFIKEVSTDGMTAEELPKMGDLISVDMVFKAGDVIDVTGTSKGKGFAGGVKRHGFRGGPKTHGQSDRHRAPGSIGQGTTPGRVYKGKRMAGHMGVDTVTVSNLKVVDVDAENKKLYILGLVPGYKGAMILVTQKGEDKKYVALLKTKAAESNSVDETIEEVATSDVANVEEVKVEDAVAAEVAETSAEEVVEPAVDVQEETKEEAVEESKEVVDEEEKKEDK